MASFSGNVIGELVPSDNAAWYADARLSGTQEYATLYPLSFPDFSTTPAIPVGSEILALSSTGTWPQTGNYTYVKLDVRTNVFGTIARGEDGTGREQNLGAAPADGMGVGFDYFEKLWLDPTELDVGNVVSELDFTIELQSTYRTSNLTITAITNNAGDGITVTPSGVPTSLVPLQTKNYTVTIGTQGPPTINGTIEWVTDARTVTLTITGNRIVIFPKPPQRPITETLEWQTDIIRLASGKEQRHALRRHPRQRISFDLLLTKSEDISEVMNLFVDWTSRVFGVPVWWEERAITSDVSVSDTVILVEDAARYSDFRASGLCMIFSVDDSGGIDTFDVVEITSTDDSPQSVTLTTGVSNAYTVGNAFIVPVRSANLVRPARVSTSRDGGTASYNVEFESLTNAPSFVPGADNYEELNDEQGIPTPILDDKNYLNGDRLLEEFFLNVQRLDYGTGLTTLLTQEDRARRATPFKWDMEDEEELRKVRRLLYSLRGRHRNVWLPTYRQDFELAQDSGVGGSGIVVKNWGFSKYVRGGSPYTGLVIRKNDGTNEYYRITGATEDDATEETITITPTLQSDALVADAERIELMIYARMNSDSVTFRHNWQAEEGDVIEAQAETSFIGDIINAD